MLAVPPLDQGLGDAVLEEYVPTAKQKRGSEHDTPARAVIMFATTPAGRVMIPHSRPFQCSIRLRVPFTLE